MVLIFDGRSASFVSVPLIDTLSLERVTSIPVHLGQCSPPAYVLSQVRCKTSPVRVRRQLIELEWPDLATVPRDHLVRLRSVRVVQDDQEAMAADVRLPVGIEIGFTVLGDGEPVFPKIRRADERGNVAFNAMDTDRRWHEPASPGEYLNGLDSPEPPERRTPQRPGRDLLLWDDEAAESRRAERRGFIPRPGPGRRRLRARAFTGQWKGVVRPLLDWTTGRR